MPLLNCSLSPEGYHFENNNSVYKLCYPTCKKCNISGNDINHNCIECKYDYNYEVIYDIYKNCYKLCPNIYDKLIENKSECVSDCANDNLYQYEFRKKCYTSCPHGSIKRENEKDTPLFNFDSKYFCKPICNESTPFEMILTQQCVKKCDFKYIQDKSCIINFIFQDNNKNNNNTETEEKDDEREKEIKAYDIMIQNVDELLSEPDFNTSDIENGKETTVEFGEMKIKLTTSKNQKDDINNVNMTTLDFEECEVQLRKAYNIPENEMIFMKIIEVNQEGMKIPKIEYDVFCRLNGQNLIKLSLSFCQESKIDLSIPIKITESLDKLNSSSGYYNDLCYSATSESGTDINLDDRKKEFIDNNKTVCQEGCVFIDYDTILEKAKCSCKVTESSASFRNINIKNIANFKLLSCASVLFSKKGMKNNYGSYSLIPILVLHFAFIISFYVKNIFNKIEIKIKDIIFAIKNWYLVKQYNREQRRQKILKIRQRKKEEKKEGQRKKEEKNKDKEDKENDNRNDFVKIKEIKLKKSEDKYPDILPPVYEQYSDKINPPNKRKRPILINVQNNCENLIQINPENNFKKNSTSGNTNSQSLNILNKITKKEEKIEKSKEIMKRKDIELSDLKYNLALKYDKRSYCSYYISLLRIKHSFIFTFFNNDDYNSKIIKIDLFLFGFSLYYTVNAFFFSDDTMHKIYEDKGAFNFIYQLPQIIYSSLISGVINFLLKYLALSEGLIIDFKKDKKDENLEKRKEDLDYKLKIKFILYFIISTIFLLFFWYYLSMFCAVYVNTQIHLIKDTLISFSLSLVYPFLIYLIPGLCRIPALSNRKNKRKYLYGISKIIQMI